MQKYTFLPGPVNAPSPYSTFQTLYASAQCQQQQLSTLHQLTKKLSTKALSEALQTRSRTTPNLHNPREGKKTLEKESAIAHLKEIRRELFNSICS